MKRRVIAIVYKDMGLGGVQKKIIDICVVLSKNPRVVVYLFLLRRRGEFLNKIPARVRIVDLNISLSLPFVLFLPPKLFFAFRRYKPNIVLAMMDTFGCSAICASLLSGSSGPPVIVGQEVFSTGFIRYRPAFWLRSFLIQSLYPHASAIVAVSDAIKRDLADHFHVPKHKIRVIRNWVKTEPNDQENREQKDIDVLYCGRFSKEKNLSLLVESFSALSRLYPHVVLCLLGCGNEENAIRNHVLRLGIADRVLFPGFSDHVQNFLRRSKMFVMTSITGEGIPLAILEAMEARVPVITTPFPGADEVVVRGVTGFIGKNKTELSAFMKLILTNRSAVRKVTQQAQKLRRKVYSLNNRRQFIHLLA